MNKNAAVIQGKVRDFQAYGIRLQFTKQALRKIAELAHKEKTGARGLTRIVENTLIKYEKVLPSTHIKKLTVTKDLVDDPENFLEMIINQDSIEKFVYEFIKAHGIELKFDQDAFDELMKRSKKEKREK